eukprot:2219971-Lingulodinium_polyedra.AAC.1
MIGSLARRAPRGAPATCDAPCCPSGNPFCSPRADLCARHAVRFVGGALGWRRLGLARCGSVLRGER